MGTRASRKGTGPDLRRRLQRLGEQPEFLLARAAACARPGRCGATDARRRAGGRRRRCRRAGRPRPPFRGPGSCRDRCRPSAPGCAARCRGSTASARSSGRLQADRTWSLRQWPSSSSSKLVSSIAAGLHLLRQRVGGAGREGDQETVVEQFRPLDVAAGIGKGEQHAIELAAVKRLAGRGLVSSRRIELQVRPLRAEARQQRRQQERRDGRDDAHAQFAGQRLARGADHVGRDPRSRAGCAAPSRRRAAPSGVKRTTRRVRSTSVTPSRVSSSLRPAERVDWVTKQASAARPKWPCVCSATRYWSCLRVGR